VQYTRNGQFSLDKNGCMVNAAGRQADRLRRRSERPDPGRRAVAAADQHRRPEAGGDHQGRHRNEPRFARRPPRQTPFNANDPTTYNKQTPVDVYDTLGNAHVMSTFYVKTAPAPGTCTPAATAPK
jgi:flagellar hook protein FlgE